jgi:lysozyme family protein
MKVLKVAVILFFLVGALLVNTKSNAQCAMCQATVESNLKSGGTTGSGLNGGIMYLLAAPYLAIAGIGLLWYKKYRKKNIAINIKEDKIHLN